MTGTYLAEGSWNVICDFCGRKFKAYQLTKNWKGNMVCRDDYEPRHPMDYIKTHAEDMTVPYTRPRPADIFVGNLLGGLIKSTINDSTFNGFVLNG